MFNDKYKLLLLFMLCLGFFFYSGFLYVDAPVSKKDISGKAIEGKILWQQKNCTSCHQVYGLGGHLGPDLTHVSSRRTPEYITAFLKNGTVTMPNFDLSGDEIDALLAFLENIDSSGNGDPRSFSIQFNGTIQQKQ